METDILIVGSGCAGLYCALNLPRDKKITVITKSDVKSSDSYLAQGGICVLRDESDYDSFFEDTMRAGHYENNRDSVDIMIKSSSGVIDDLICIGVDFTKRPNGKLDYTREGAHSNKRILYHEDITGKEITSKLLNATKALSNVNIVENATLLDIIVKNGETLGGVVLINDMVTPIYACETVLATGGVGGLYKHSTNFRHLTGDGIAVAMRHGVELQNIDYVQIHPTTFYTKSEDERSFLISESVRGEGATLRDKNMNRFVDELLPRDKVTEAILKQMEIDGTDFVWEDLRDIPKKELLEHFPNIVEHCRKMGYDVLKEPIPVVPAQHYFMGGIKVDKYSHTSLAGLYAIGETACNGVHGKNRLASNSLLESLVFARRAAWQIAKSTRKLIIDGFSAENYKNPENITKENAEMVRQEIKRRTANV